jgi:hypothetical protein
MRALFVLVILFVLTGVHDPSWAGSSKSSRTGRAGSVQNGPIVRDRSDIHDSRGRAQGYTERDPILKNRVDIYDGRGREDGYKEGAAANAPMRPKHSAPPDSPTQLILFVKRFGG